MWLHWFHILSCEHWNYTQAIIDTTHNVGQWSWWLTFPTKSKQHIWFRKSMHLSMWTSHPPPARLSQEFLAEKGLSESPPSYDHSHCRLLFLPFFCQSIVSSHYGHTDPCQSSGVPIMVRPLSVLGFPLWSQTPVSPGGSHYGKTDPVRVLGFPL